MTISKKDLEKLRHPSEYSRFILTLFVLIPFVLVIAAIIIFSFGMILIMIPFVLLSLWLGMKLLVASLLNKKVRVSSKSFPTVWAAIKKAKEEFSYKGPIDAYVYEASSYNAMILPLLTKKVILLNSDVLADQKNINLL